MNELNGKTALITGASAGIGAAAAQYLAGIGVNIVAAARSDEALSKLVSDITASGGKAVACSCDVGDYGQVQAAVRKAVDTFGGIDILVNNAGTIEPIARIEDVDPETWSQAIQTNLVGAFNALHCVVGPMLERGSGTVVNISSGAATSALEGWSHYCSSKAAALMLTRCADKEYAGKGIRVTGLSPGTVATDMQVSIKASGINPVSQLDPSVHIPADWVGKAIVWLCKDGADEFAGQDFSLKSDEGRARVGLPGT